MNIGILGTGSIARTMVAEFAKVPAFRCEAVCSRQQATGEALAQQFSIPKVYSDYDAIVRAMEPVPRMPIFMGAPLLIYNGYQTLL